MPPEWSGRRWVVGTLSYTAAGLAVLFVWLLLGDFVQNMKERAIQPISMLMLRGFNAPDVLVGVLVSSVPAAIGLILAPVISVKSDRYRSRWGRRIPFILLPTPFIVLSMFGLALTPALGEWLHDHVGPHGPSIAACRIAAFAFFWTWLEIMSIIANCLFGALINDIVPQEVVGRFFGLFRIVGLVAGIIFNYSLMGKVADHMKLIYACLGVIYGVGITLMCLMIKEGEYPPPPPPLGSRSHWERGAAVISYLKECYGNPFFLRFFLATTIGGLATGPLNAFQVFHARSVNMSDDLYGKCVALSYCFSVVLSYPLGMMADRFHPLRMGIVTMALYAAVCAFGFFTAVTAHTFFIALLLHVVLSGCYFTGTASVAQRLLPRNKFGEIASAGGMIGGVIGIFFSPSLGLFIQLMHHNYRYMFLLASILSITTCVCFVILLRKYNELGGDAAFVPPQGSE
jgi:MFS family permease